MDHRELATLPSELVDESHVDLSQFTGSSLVAFNDAPFMEEDWSNIQSIHQSSKAESPQKIGKFGIGFNSVYHTTGTVVI